MSVLYAQTSGNQSTNAGTFTPIPGLSITLPGGVGIMAIVTLNIPNPYAEGNDYPGATFGITVNGAPSPVVASFTSGDQEPSSSGRVPTTLVASVPLVQNPQTIIGVWYGVRGSTVVIDTPATLSAVIDD